MPAKSAALPRLVEPEELLLANTVSYQLQSYMPFLGLALSATVLGYLYRVFPSSFFMTAVVVNASSFFFSAYFINKLPVIEPERGEIETHPWRDFLDGIAVIRKHATLKTFLAVSLLMNLAISPFFPVYVETNVLWFGGKPQTLSWFEFTFFAGLVIGGYLVGWSKIVRVGFEAGSLWCLHLERWDTRPTMPSISA